MVTSGTEGPCQPQTLGEGMCQGGPSPPCTWAESTSTSLFIKSYSDPELGQGLCSPDPKPARSPAPGPAPFPPAQLLSLQVTIPTAVSRPPYRTGCTLLWRVTEACTLQLTPAMPPHHAPPPQCPPPPSLQMSPASELSTRPNPAVTIPLGGLRALTTNLSPLHLPPQLAPTAREPPEARRRDGRGRDLASL